MMPSRSGINIPQHCVGCDRAFCGASCHFQGLSRIANNPICSSNCLEAVNERFISRIPHIAHGKNHHEQEITERCIRQMGRSLQDVVSEWIGSSTVMKLIEPGWT